MDIPQQNPECSTWNILLPCGPTWWSADVPRGTSLPKADIPRAANGAGGMHLALARPTPKLHKILALRSNRKLGYAVGTWRILRTLWDG